MFVIRFCSCLINGWFTLEFQEQRAINVIFLFCIKQIERRVNSVGSYLKRKKPQHLLGTTKQRAMLVLGFL